MEKEVEKYFENEFLKKFTLGSNSKISDAQNVVINTRGEIESRKGWKTFGEMVDVLWKINKQNRKMGFVGEYTIKLPLKGVKPIYKKTIKSK